MLERIWDGLSVVIKMNDRVEALAATVSQQQAKIEDLTGRIIRLETALEIALSSRRAGVAPASLPPPGSG